MSVYAEFVAPITAYPLSKVLVDHPGVRVDVDVIVPAGGSSHYVWIHGDGHEDVLGALASLASIEDVQVIDELPDRMRVRFEWTSAGSAVFEIVEAVDGRIVGTEGTAEGWTLRIRFPDQDALRDFYESCQDRSLDVQLRRQFDPDTSFAEEDFGISPKQRATLEAAFEAGYFDVPRGATLQDLAEEMGISEQGVSERLRRGLSSFLEATLSEDVDGDEDESTGRGGRA